MPMRNFRSKYRRADAVIGIDPVDGFYRRFRAHIPLTDEQEHVVRRALSERTLAEFPYLAKFSAQYEKGADFFVARILLGLRRKNHALAWLALAASYDRRASGFFALYLWDCKGPLMKLRAKACLDNSSTKDLLEDFLENDEKGDFQNFLLDQKTNDAKLRGPMRKVK
jgi:hypothetical protein